MPEPSLAKIYHQINRIENELLILHSLIKEYSGVSEISNIKLAKRPFTAFEKQTRQRIQNKTRGEKQRVELADWYVNRLIISQLKKLGNTVSPNEITEEMRDKKRSEIISFRTKKEQLTSLIKQSSRTPRK